MNQAAYLWSDDFWNTAITAFIAVAVGGIAVWAALYAANPRRGIVWEETRRTDFWATGAPSSIEVTHDGNSIEYPSLVDVKIKNIGRRDVEPAMFSSGNDSLIFDLQGKIVEVVDSSPTPETGGVGATSKNNTRLHIHPFLLSRGHSVTYSVLIDLGQAPRYIRRAECSTAQIAHNPIRNASKIAANRRRIIMITAFALAAILVIAGVPKLIDYNDPLWTIDECQGALEANSPLFDNYCDIVPKGIDDIPPPDPIFTPKNKATKS